MGDRLKLPLHARDHLPGGVDPIPGLGASYYKATQKLGSDVGSVVFDDISQDFTTLRLEWAAAQGSGATGEGILMARFNGDDVDLEHDYWWHVACPDPFGTAALNADDSSNEYGGLGLLDYYGARNQFSAGHVLFPDYVSSDGDSIGYAGCGHASSDASKGYSGDVYVAGGWRQGAGPLTKITIYAFGVGDVGGTAVNLAAGSRFTLLGF